MEYLITGLSQLPVPMEGKTEKAQGRKEWRDEVYTREYIPMADAWAPEDVGRSALAEPQRFSACVCAHTYCVYVLFEKTRSTQGPAFDLLL